jgi:nucleoside-diphosphate-sugar epimerase
VTLVYVDDLVDCVYRALTVPEAAGQAFTAWDGRPVTTAEFFAHYTRMLGKKPVRAASTPR